MILAKVNWDTVQTGVVTAIAVGATMGTFQLTRKTVTRERLKRLMTYRNWFIFDEVSVVYFAASVFFIHGAPFRPLYWTTAAILVANRVLHISLCTVDWVKIVLLPDPPDETLTLEQQQKALIRKRLKTYGLLNYTICSTVIYAAVIYYRLIFHFG